jgi:tRNA(Ile)-lysidine synthase
LSGPDAFVATLGGARILASDQVRIVREAGEAARGGLAPVALQPGQTTVWDGRWAFEGGAPGQTISALAGQAAGLSPADRARLHGIPASDRPSLPVLRDVDGHVWLPSLAMAALGDHIEGTKGLVRSLVGPRFSAACGLVRREDEIGQSPAWRNRILRPMLGRKIRADG